MHGMQPHPLRNFLDKIWVDLSVTWTKFDQIWKKFGKFERNLGKIWINWGEVRVRVIKVWVKSKFCIPKNIGSPTAMQTIFRLFYKNNGYLGISKP